MVEKQQEPREWDREAPCVFLLSRENRKYLLSVNTGSEGQRKGALFGSGE
jgi:hypothetical protein